MNILILNWRDLKHPEAGGAEGHLTEIFKRLVERGHTVVLLTTRFRGSQSTDNQHGIIVYRWGRTYTFNWEAPLLIRSVLRRHQIDCIIDDVNKIPFFTPRWFPRIPTGVFFHHLFGRTVYELAARPMADYVLFLENLSGWGYRNVPCCTVSKSTAEELVAKGFDRANITIVENSVDTIKFTPDPVVVKQENLLLYTGRLKRYKNVGAILDAMHQLKENGRLLELVVAGTGDDLEHLQSRVVELGLDAQVRFAGYVSEVQMIDLYRRAALFVNPSLKEGWGITNIEANACGTAVIANDAPGLRDSVVHGKTGIIYKRNDTNALAEAIVALLDNTDGRQLIEHQARQWALEFSWDRSAGKVETWLEQIVSRKRS